MRRDFEMIRELLLDVEAAPGPFDVVSLGDEHSRTLFHNIVLLTESGYLDSNDGASTMRQKQKSMVLTFRGHELLDAIRSEETWVLLKERLPIASGEVPFHILEQYAFHLAAKKVLSMSP